MTKKMLKHLQTPPNKYVLDTYGWHCNDCRVTPFELVMALLNQVKNK